jgi:hypothetical protein
VESALGGESLTIRIGYRGKEPLASPDVFVRVFNEHGTPVTLLASRFTGDALPVLPPEGAIDCTIPEVCLAPGSYLLNVSLEAGLEVVDAVSGAARLDVEPGPFFASGRTPGAENGLVLTRHRWSPAREETPFAEV